MQKLVGLLLVLHRALEPGTYFTCVQFVGPLSSYPLSRTFESPSNEDATLLGVTEVLTMEDLEFSVLLDKSIDEDCIEVECGPGDCG